MAPARMKPGFDPREMGAWASGRCPGENRPLRHSAERAINVRRACRRHESSSSCLQQAAHEIWRQSGEGFTKQAGRVDSARSGHRDGVFRVEVRDVSKDHTVVALALRAMSQPPRDTPL